MTTKIAVSLPDHLVTAARRAVEDGQARSVSAFVAAALEDRTRPGGLRRLLDEWDEELGPPSQAAQRWADEQKVRLGWQD